MRTGIEQIIATLSPVQKMDLADILYDAAQQEIEAMTTPLTDDQMREIDRRIAAADAGQMLGEPWTVVCERLRAQL